MIAPISSNTARAAVADYRRESMLRQGNAEDKVVLERLEADPNGHVSTALARLKTVSRPLLIFHVLQAARLARSSSDVVRYSNATAKAYWDKACAARDLAAFCKGRSPIELRAPLAALADFLDAQGSHHESTPARLGIKRTACIENAPARLALRHLGPRLRVDLGQRRLDHLAVRLLVEVALGLDHSLPAHVVKDSLRKQGAPLGREAVGVQGIRKTTELPKRPKSLKTASKTKAF
jgi:hypothetical protein